jgi:hypothetical protein
VLDQRIDHVAQKIEMMRVVHVLHVRENALQVASQVGPREEALLLFDELAQQIVADVACALQVILDLSRVNLLSELGRTNVK